MKKDDYNLTFFAYIREEINKRIEIHYKLVLAKFALAGGLFAFLLSQGDEIKISSFLLASIFAFLVDIVILENLGWVRSAGHYIKNNIENTEQNILRWETDFTQFGGSWNCFSVQGYLFGVWVIAPAFLIGAFIFDFDPANKPEIFMFIVAAYLAAYTVHLVFKNLGQFMQVNMENRKSPINDKTT